VSAAARWLTDSPQHRYREQAAFLAAFPAYTVTRAGAWATLWYRGPAGGVAGLAWAVDGDGLRLVGDAAVAARTLQTGAPPLMPEAALPADPPAHRQLFRRWAGIRPVVFPEPFEGLIWAILGQQITVTFAARLKGAVAARFGPVLPGGGGHAFPTAAELAGASEGALRAAGLSRQKAATLLSLSRVVARGLWDPASLYGTPADEATAVLTRFPGIGPWTAEYLLVRVYGHPDVLPVGDAALRRTWAALTGTAADAAGDHLREAGRAWAGRRSDLAFCLWLEAMARRRAAAAAPGPDEPPRPSPGLRGARPSPRAGRL
jgi:3-methyladenine DNA glycosylase/8-oxoguanine DNA glycosylase